MSSNTPTEYAAGAVLWRPSTKHGARVALVHRPRYKDWSLPKGKAELGETPPMTAYREVLEETGFESELGRQLTTVRYAVPSGQKRVVYFAARAGVGEFTPNKEVDKLEWLSVDKAQARVTHGTDRSLLETFAAASLSVSTVLFVRHARAGVRESWEGDDDSRPLDAKGTRQAQALRAQLIPFAPVQLHSASVERCVATLSPLAAALGLPISQEKVFTEAAYRRNPSAARRRITELAKAGVTVAVCSQGGVIPGVVKSLAGRADLSVGPVNTPKSSFWVLTFDGSSLLQADSYPAPEV
ncbi:NUDIX hydrolase [Nakamurella antarctica]|uniref:NUDIX hydrolase n=1 Tax=Nakamurella antarctica TaxID=1902245 RepID=UPI0013DE4EEB|nr:NUDIX domain-containing protein [Nakamurella antarctica]